MISHPRETLFVHIPKTGGQSVETVFLRDLGLSWRERDTLLLRHNDDRAKGPEKLAHLYASEYVALGHLEADRFARYLKFTIVRHPFDRVLSEYRYRAAAMQRRSAGRDMPDLDAFLQTDSSDEYSDLSRHLVPQVRYIRDAQGRCLVDEVLRFEDLAQQIAPLFTRIFGAVRALPHHNKSAQNAEMRLTAAQKEQVFLRYRADFEAFDYAP
ncbi:sulfotransferase family 2 domain-containing protein [Sedimentitalea nanhaiensis]|uniref:Sulfotransferase family protein n=1 Tax=Sedimentitalea nanhaiensis TaxID=999627 RepID=A0A1I7BQ67_9RHOB|nr:sulfotransferase family 2 domain-containing protein [Sedimentitalea nanhaiensis]SFT89350.1 Sulfotransferase family protein [Sedimentitalea nanhaiensis]